MANAAAQQEAAKLMSGPQLLTLMATGAGRQVRAQFAAGVNLQKAEFHSQGKPVSFTAGYEIASDGAVLVRPDGHLAARWTGSAPDPAGALRGVAARVLGAPDTPTPPPA